MKSETYEVAGKGIPDALIHDVFLSVTETEPKRKISSEAVHVQDRGVGHGWVRAKQEKWTRGWEPRSSRERLLVFLEPSRRCQTTTRFFVPIMTTNHSDRWSVDLRCFVDRERPVNVLPPVSTHMPQRAGKLELMKTRTPPPGGFPGLSPALGLVCSLW